MNNNNHGGFRIGAGRKKGSKTSKNTTVFYAKCTEKEKQKLKEYLTRLRSFVFLFIVLFFVSPVFAQNIQSPANLPQGVSVNIIQTKNSFKFFVKKVSPDCYSLAINDAVIVLGDGSVHRLVEPLSFNYIYEDKPLPNRSIFNSEYYFELAPLENIRYTSRLNKFPEPVKISQIGAYAEPLNFKNKNSIIKSEDYIIKIPLINETTKEIHILEFGQRL